MWLVLNRFKSESLKRSEYVERNRDEQSKFQMVTPHRLVALRFEA